MKEYKPTIALVTLLIGVVVGGSTLTKTNAEIPMQDASTQVGLIATIEAQVNNHEARITNTENDVKDLQNKTDTPPSITRVEVPIYVPVKESPEPEVQPTPQPEPVTVVAWEQIAIEGSEDKDCKYTYSDGTTYQWHWQTVEYNQGTKITHRLSICDNRAIGIEKR